MTENIARISHPDFVNKELKNPVRIKFSIPDYLKMKKAEQYTGIRIPNLIRSLTKDYLRDVKEGRKERFDLSFELKQVIDKSEPKTTTVLFCDEDYETLNEIFQCVPISSSNFIKYIIMPEIDKIIKNKGRVR